MGDEGVPDRGTTVSTGAGVGVTVGVGGSVMIEASVPSGIGNNVDIGSGTETEVVTTCEVGPGFGQEGSAGAQAVNSPTMSRARMYERLHFRRRYTVVLLRRYPLI